MKTIQILFIIAFLASSAPLAHAGKMLPADTPDEVRATIKNLEQSAGFQLSGTNYLYAEGYTPEAFETLAAACLSTNTTISKRAHDMVYDLIVLWNIPDSDLQRVLAPLIQEEGNNADAKYYLERLRFRMSLVSANEAKQLEIIANALQDDADKWKIREALEFVRVKKLISAEPLLKQRLNTFAIGSMGHRMVEDAIKRNQEWTEPEGQVGPQPIQTIGDN